MPSSPGDSWNTAPYGEGSLEEFLHRVECIYLRAQEHVHQTADILDEGRRMLSNFPEGPVEKVGPAQTVTKLRHPERRFRLSVCRPTLRPCGYPASVSFEYAAVQVRSPNGAATELKTFCGSC